MWHRMKLLSNKVAPFIERKKKINEYNLCARFLFYSFIQKFERDFEKVCHINLSKKCGTGCTHSKIFIKLHASLNQN